MIDKNTETNSQNRSKKKISKRNFVFIYFDAETISLDFAFAQLNNTLHKYQINQYLLCKNGKTLSCWFTVSKHVQIYSMNKFCLYNCRHEKLAPDIIEHPTKIEGLNKVFGLLSNVDLKNRNSYITNIPTLLQD